MKYTVSVLVDLSREQMLKRLDEPENMKLWQPTLQSYELLGADPFPWILQIHGPYGGRDVPTGDSEGNECLQGFRRGLSRIGRFRHEWDGAVPKYFCRWSVFPLRQRLSFGLSTTAVQDLSSADWTAAPGTPYNCQ